MQALSTAQTVNAQSRQKHERTKKDASRTKSALVSPGNAVGKTRADGTRRGNSFTEPLAVDNDSNKFYAVRFGKAPGVYRHLAHAQDAVRGYHGAQYRRFRNFDSAMRYAYKYDKWGCNPRGCTADSCDSNGNSYDAFNASGYDIEGYDLSGYDRDGYDRYGLNRRGGTKDNAREFCNDIFIEKVFSIAQTRAHVCLFTHGAVVHNRHGQPRAGYAIYWSDYEPYNQTGRVFGDQTDTNAGLAALFYALGQIIEVAKYFDNCKFLIVTKSPHIAHSVTDLSRMWTSRGWKSSAGKPLRYQDLIQDVNSRIVRITKELHVDLRIGVEASGIELHGVQLVNYLAIEAAKGEFHYPGRCRDVLPAARNPNVEPAPIRCRALGPPAPGPIFTNFDACFIPQAGLPPQPVPTAPLVYLPPAVTVSYGPAQPPVPELPFMPMPPPSLPTTLMPVVRPPEPPLPLDAQTFAPRSYHGTPYMRLPRHPPLPPPGMPIFAPPGPPPPGMTTFPVPAPPGDPTASTPAPLPPYDPKVCPFDVVLPPIHLIPELANGYVSPGGAPIPPPPALQPPPPFTQGISCYMPPPPRYPQAPPVYYPPPPAATPYTYQGSYPAGSPVAALGQQHHTIQASAVQPAAYGAEVPGASVTAAYGQEGTSVFGQASGCPARIN